MPSINLTEARVRLSELVRRAEGGEEIIITRYGKAVAKLIAMPIPKKPYRSLAAFRATMPKSPTPSVVLIRAIRDEGY